MCHGHPHYHPCSHTSVKWLYCPEAIFDLDTGYETPCSNPIYSKPQPTTLDCPLQNCNFKVLKGSWNCCVCGKGPNTQGWCTMLRHRVDFNPLTGRVENMELPCGHGCCSMCSGSSASRSSSPEMSFSEVRKGKSSRKAYGSSRSSANKRSPAYELGGDMSPVAEEEQAASSSAAPNPRGSRKPGHEDHQSKRPKGSSSKKKSQKSRGHH
ncbi:hypothetical protein F5X99DRAFT_273194 [Biscogniauxia marginata]|nr:hypothetical protein F5X99DRAFT_273194 [Biscogniauxia marginata]